MQAVRTIILIILAVILTVFAVANSQIVAVSIWPGFVAELPLSILIICVFLIGFLPIFLMHVGNRWLLGRQIAAQKQTINTLQATPAPTPAPSPAATPLSSTDMPPQ